VIARRLREPPVRGLLINSAVVGAQVTGLVLVLWFLAGSSRRAGAEHARADARGRPLSVFLFPPIVVGVGVLAILRVAAAAAASLRVAGDSAVSADARSSLEAWVAAPINPSLFVMIGIAWVLGPFLILGWRSAERRRNSGRSAMDAARLLGVSRLRAFWLAAPDVVTIWFGRLLLAWALAATNLTPALLASPGTDGLTVGPGFLILADGQADARALAAGLALGIFTLDLIALAVASACRALPRIKDFELP
jgi:hypothetical protein